MTTYCLPSDLMRMLCIPVHTHNSINSETGTTPYLKTFGDSERGYLLVSEHSTLAQKMTSYMTQLQQDLDSVRAASKSY